MCIVTACNNNNPAQEQPQQKQPKDTSIVQGKNKTDESVAGNFSTQTLYHFDSTAIKDFLKKYPDFSPFASDLRKFYRQRNYAYAWYEDSGLIEQAASLHNRFLQITDEGVITGLSYQKDFNALMNDDDSPLTKEPMNAEAELMLTAQYFNYARKVWHGLGEKQTKELDWYLPRKKLDLQTLLDSLLYDSNKDFIAVEPVYFQYARLKSYLKNYRAIESAGGWATIKPGKKAFKEGDSSASIQLLRKRLFITGDLKGDTNSMIFDSDLEEAVKNFQKRNGWKEDGLAGRAVLNELNRSVTEIIKQIIVNMERCRWVPYNPKGEYFLVNIPAYKLYIFNKDSMLWNMNIVAGKPIHKTVIFNGNLKYVVFSPYWNVPTSIYKKEVLPGIRRDPNYLKKHNMERIGNSVREKPGPNNSLGQVKFLFPNSYSIYMHDTPAKSLFNEDKRAFSHGCIRLSEPKKLAMYLLRNYPEWTEEKIDAAMNAGKEQYVTLKETVPVVIAYFTAWVDTQGKLNLRQDVYNRDNQLAKMLIAKK
jgi:murein L,D-transpeptidase YcbB/YkuD